ncbi:hypothetical protein BGX20_007968 [Mortierella sp. AD010]|nr:hypothetical protein BGX20_007968 [Mortierella sp. AD010]
MDTVSQSIIDRAIERTVDDDMWVTYHILYYAGKEFPKVNHWIFKTEFFEKLKRQILQSEGSRIQPIAVSLMYEMCRIHTLQEAQLASADVTFLNCLLDIVERTRNDDAESFNYNTIKLLLVFNEQYMLGISSRRGTCSQSKVEFPYSGNPLLAVLLDRPGLSSTFGENLIFMLNRAEDTAVQMLTLKLLYALFTSPNLCEFFYTNDLHVLVDVVIRELWDLPEEQRSLRHAYLRVLGPLLTNTQLKNATYKRAELVRLLRDLGGGDLNSTLRYQLQEQQRKEQILELERAQLAKFTYRDRESSASSFSSLARWTSDHSGRSSPVLSSEIEMKRRHSELSKLSISCNSDTLQVPGYEESKARNQQRPFVDSSEECKDIFIGIVPMEPEPTLQSSSPTTLRLVERVLREWLDNEMKNGAGTTGLGLSIRGVTDGKPLKVSEK